MKTAITKHPPFDFTDYPDTDRPALRTVTAELIAALRTQIRSPDPAVSDAIDEMGQRIHDIAGDEAMHAACAIAAKCLGNYPVACILIPAWKGIGSWPNAPHT